MTNILFKSKGTYMNVACIEHGWQQNTQNPTDLWSQGRKNFEWINN
jgi:hypothetical protein